MKIINYWDCKNRRILSSGDYVPFEFITFPGGEEHVKGLSIEDSQLVEIRANIRSSQDVIRLLLVNDALRRQNNKVCASITYFPYARQDRAANLGEAFSLKVMADLINSCKFEMVAICDPHSDVTPALINNVYVYQQWEYSTKVDRILNEAGIKEYGIVVPAAGALKKCEKWAEKCNKPIIGVGMKHRDTATGKLQYEGIYWRTDGAYAYNLVVDDICDGGYTFELLSDYLKGSADRNILFVTHGIFSKGFDKLLEKYGKIITTDSYREDYPQDLIDSGKLVVIEALYPV